MLPEKLVGSGDFGHFLPDARLKRGFFGVLPQVA